MRLEEIPTPALLLDLDVLEANLDRMSHRTERLGVRLRPHVKTHKCVEVARLQRARGASGITASTLAEARVFADHGFDDVTWAFPVIPGRIEQARRLAERIRLGLLVDSPEAVAMVEGTGSAFRVWLEVDCGQHRSGVDPGSAESVDLAASLAGSRSIEFAGILTHSGHAYAARSVEELRGVAEQERRVMAGFAAGLRERGIDVPEVSVGSTPAMSVAERLDGVTEARPGNYALFDHTQTVLGCCTPRDCAATVLSTVVSNSRGRDEAVIDAGALALSKDAGSPHAPAATMGEIFRDYGSGELAPDLRVTRLDQEHGMITRALPVGRRVRILPNHSCLTVALFDEYHVVRGEDVVDRWKIWRER